MVVLALGASLLAWPQTGEPPVKQTPPPTEQKQQEDPLQKIRDAQGRSSKAVDTFTMDTVGVRRGKVKELITFKALVRNSRQEIVSLLFSLQDAPRDAQIDPNTGTFAWVPMQAGSYIFDIVATDPADPLKTARQRVTIVVTKPLEHFGYEFFAAPRAAIMGRMMAIQQGLAKPGIPFSARQGMSDSLLPDAVNQAVNPDRELGFPPKTGNGNGSGNGNDNGNGNGNGKAGTNGQPPTQGGNGQTGTETGQTPPVHGGQATQPSTSFGQPNLNPWSVATQGQDPSFIQSIDALKYFVGPFDMMGSNVFVPAPERYQLGTGDVLNLRVWSPTVDAKEYTAKIDAQGGINLPTSGRRLVLRGQTLAQVEGLLRKELRRDLRDADVTVTLRELRTMTLTVLGEAFMPGSYQVPAVATLFNAIYMFGGPTENGTLRRIELRRNDGTKRTFDLYKFLVYGESQQDVPLQPGDTIFIPPVESRITVQGEVGRPAIYESLPGERLKQILGFAGSVKPTGVSQRISHSTVAPGQGLKLVDVDLTATGPANDPPVYAGDTIDVFSVRPELTNVITLEGAVDQPGQYALAEGMTVLSLIQRARGLLPDAYRARADLFRQNDDKSLTLIPIDLASALAGDASHNVPLKAFDRLKIYGVDDVQWMGTRQVIVRGAVRKPGSFYRADSMRVVDLLIQSGGLSGEAFQEQGFLQRYNDDGTIGDVIKIDFRKVAVGDQQHNVELRDRDVLMVQSVTEAQFVPEQQVQVLGAVQSPGTFTRAANLRLADLLQMAGGLMPNAGDMIEIASARVPDGTKARQYRVADVLSGAANPEIEAGDLVSVPQLSQFQMSPRTVILMGAVKRPGTYAINATTERISDLIERAGGLNPTAFTRGAQFVREPGRLSTLSQVRLSPRIREVLERVNEEEYKRAMAKAEVEKLRVVKSIAGGSTSDTNVAAAALGLGAAGAALPKNETLPKVQLQGTTVSPAREFEDRELSPLGNLNVRLDEALKHKGSPADLVLEEGDVIIVPETPSTVTIGGAVMVPSAVLFVSGKTVSYYVERSGGFTVDVAKDRILVIRAGGEVLRATARTRVELGDFIFVPSKVMAERLSDRQADIDAISKNITSAGIIFAIIRSLLP